ncbi:MAG: DUF1080 domain-containing protein [Acidimicrobiia bacterium]|nr:DUF1080 domain-containing protein [Acidimicrobiia bacterium]
MGAADRSWKAIFNGKNLEGWKAPDMTYFSVEDGAITGPPPTGEAASRVLCKRPFFN